MGDYDFDIPVSFRHRIRFTKDAFAPGNQVVSDLLETERERKVIVFIETEIDRLFPDLQEQIRSYLAEQNNLVLTEVVIMAGGEDCKISKIQIMNGIVPIERNGIDRHSYVFCIGGGAFLVLADLIARVAVAPSELPVGVVTALVGGPFFLYLLRRKGSRYDFA